MPSLIERGILTTSDLGGIEDLCVMRGLTHDYAEALRADPLNKVLFGMLNRATQTAKQLAAEYGLSPVSRARVGAAGPDDDDDDNPLAVT